MKTKKATQPIGKNLELFNDMKEFGATPPTKPPTYAEIIHGYCSLERIETTPESRRVLRWGHWAASRQGATRIGIDSVRHWFLWNHKGEWFKFTAHLDHVTVEKSDPPVKWAILPIETQQHIRRQLAAMKAGD